MFDYNLQGSRLEFQTVGAWNHFLLRNYYFCIIFRIIPMKIEANVRKTLGASTHTFKNCWCFSTHSTHANGDPDLY